MAGVSMACTMPVPPTRAAFFIRLRSAALASRRAAPVCACACSDQMSTWVEYLVLPMSTSGGRYQSVTTSCVYFFTGIPKPRARPKSASWSEHRQTEDNGRRQASDGRSTRIHTSTRQEPRCVYTSARMMVRCARRLTFSSPSMLINRFCGFRSCRVRTSRRAGKKVSVCLISAHQPCARMVGGVSMMRCV
jgi:hypothetical protein